jgi:hypothetical protein
MTSAALHHEGGALRRNVTHEGFQMDRQITITVPYNDGLDMRLALNAAAMEWSAKAAKAREAGDTIDADTCGRIAAGYSRLWEVVQAAMDAEPSLNTFQTLGGAAQDALRRRFPTLAPAPTGRLAIRPDNLRWEDRDGESDA